MKWFTFCKFINSEIFFEVVFLCFHIYYAVLNSMRNSDSDKNQLIEITVVCRLLQELLLLIVLFSTLLTIHMGTKIKIIKDALKYN